MQPKQNTKAQREFLLNKLAELKDFLAYADWASGPYTHEEQEMQQLEKELRELPYELPEP